MYYIQWYAYFVPRSEEIALIHIQNDLENAKKKKESLFVIKCKHFLEAQNTLNN
jgi:hypothetical protein